jgi:IclR family mhp operon transcriptional activator
VEQLSSGYNRWPLIVRLARMEVRQLTRKWKWPISVALFDNDGMSVRYTTIAESPISPIRVAPQSSLRILTRAHGRAFISFCSDEQRELILATLRQSDHPEDAMARDRAAIKRLISEVRKRGYAFRDPRVSPKTSNTISVPLIVDGEAVGSLGLTFYSSAMTPSEAARRYFSGLNSVAAWIGNKASEYTAD